MSTPADATRAWRGEWKIVVTGASASRGLLPAFWYRAAGLAEPVQRPTQIRRAVRVPNWPVVDGPASCGLDAYMRPLLPAALTCRRREDDGDASASVAATVRYRAESGGTLRVLFRRLVRPLLLDAVSDSGRATLVWVRCTGSAAIRTDDRDAHRLLFVRPDGGLWILDSIGLPARGVAAPLSCEQLRQLEHCFDTLPLPLGAVSLDALSRADSADRLLDLEDSFAAATRLRKPGTDVGL